MSINQDMVAYEEPTSSSFWDLNGYKYTVKRVSDGYNLCSDLMLLIKERAELEQRYASSLKEWGKRWTEKIGRGPEYGTTEGAWKGLFAEADRICQLHLAVRDQLLDSIQMNIKKWQKENYTKQTLGGLKQQKEVDEAFQKAQKPWAKKLDKCNKAKEEFHKACKHLRTAEITERNQQADTSVSEDMKRKNIQKIEEWENKRDLTRTKYEAALKDITDYNARYMEDMTEIFNKCQDMEQKRQEFTKATLFSIRDVLNLADNPEYSLTYSDLQQTVANADPSKDLKWWSQTHGIDMGMSWPTFEEFIPNQAPLNKRNSKRAGEPGDGITLTAIKKEEPAPQSFSAQNSVAVNNNRNTYSSAVNKDDSLATSANQRISSNRPDAYNNTLNPFAADDGEDLEDMETGDNPFGSDDGDDYLADDGRAGVAIRALYDYVGGEDDELTFKAGDEFEKLEEEDEQGWCKGRLHGKVGLYPANYCAEI